MSAELNPISQPAELSTQEQRGLEPILSIAQRRSRGAVSKHLLEYCERRTLRRDLVSLLVSVPSLRERRPLLSAFARL